MKGLTNSGYACSASDSGIRSGFSSAYLRPFQKSVHFPSGEKVLGPIHVGIGDGQDEAVTERIGTQRRHILSTAAPPDMMQLSEVDVQASQPGAGDRAHPPIRSLTGLTRFIAH